MSVGSAEEITTFSLFPIAEAIRYCMLDSAGFAVRPLSTVLKDRASFSGFVSVFHSNLRNLQGLVSSGADPSGLASARAVTVANFDNAPIVRAGISVLETDLAVQVIMRVESATSPTLVLSLSNPLNQCRCAAYFGG